MEMKIPNYPKFEIGDLVIAVHPRDPELAIVCEILGAETKMGDFNVWYYSLKGYYLGKEELRFIRQENALLPYRSK